MAASLPNKSIISLASAYDPAVNMTTLSNANPAIAGMESGHGLSQGDIVEINSGWPALNGKIARISDVTGDNITLEGVDTTDTDDHPAGTGGGTLRAISSFTALSQTLSIDLSGGEAQYTDYAYLEFDTEFQIPTGQSAMTMAMQFADDPNLSWYAVAKAAHKGKVPVAMQIALSSGGYLYYNGYVSFNETPTMTRNEIMAVNMGYALSAEFTRYAA